MCRDAAIGAIEEKHVQKVKLSVGDCGPATQEVGGGEDEANEAKQLKKKSFLYHCITKPAIELF